MLRSRQINNWIEVRIGRMNVSRRCRSAGDSRKEDPIGNLNGSLSKSTIRGCQLSGPMMQSKMRPSAQCPTTEKTEGTEMTSTMTDAATFPLSVSSVIEPPHASRQRGAQEMRTGRPVHPTCPRWGQEIPLRFGPSCPSRLPVSSFTRLGQKPRLVEHYYDLC